MNHHMFNEDHVMSIIWGLVIVIALVVVGTCGRSCQISQDEYHQKVMTECIHANNPPERCVMMFK